MLVVLLLSVIIINRKHKEVYKMKNILSFILMIAFIFLMTACDDVEVENTTGVIINEVCSNNASTYHT